MAIYSSTTDESKPSLQDDNDDDLETDGDGVKHYYHRNCESPGLIIFTVSNMSSKLYICIHVCVTTTAVCACV